MGNVFVWDRETPVIIYGAAFSGTRVYRNIKSFSNIVAFIDKRAPEIKTYMELPVYSAESTALDLTQRKKAVTIVAVKNIFEHDVIVNMLVSLGYENILYSHPDTSVYERKNEESLRALKTLYDKVVARKFDPDFPYVLPKTETAFSFEWRDRAVITQNSGRILAYIPIAHIAVDKYDEICIGRDSCVPIGAMFAYIEFFRSLAGDSSSGTDYYLKDSVPASTRGGGFELTRQWLNNVVRNRVTVFDRMDLAWETDRDFFLRNAPEAEWNRNGYFNIISGKHRSTFLAAKGCKFIPLSVPAEGYDAYICEPTLQRAIEYLDTKSTPKLFTPVLHPYFYYYPCEASGAFYALASKLTLILGKYLHEIHGKIDFKMLRIKDASKRWRELSRYFSRFGSHAVCVEKPTELDSLIDALYGIRINEPVECDKVYDLIIYDDDAQCISGAAMFTLLITQEEPQSPLMSFFCEGVKHWAKLTKG